jgi:hypothetical protein
MLNFKFRLYPTKEQEVAEQTLTAAGGCTTLLTICRTDRIYYTYRRSVKNLTPGDYNAAGEAGKLPSFRAF